MGGASAADRNTTTAAATGDRTKGGAPGARGGSPRSSTRGEGDVSAWEVPGRYG